jgi:hypothetical protein
MRKSFRLFFVHPPNTCDDRTPNIIQHARRLRRSAVRIANELTPPNFPRKIAAWQKKLLLKKVGLTCRSARTRNSTSAIGTPWHWDYERVARASLLKPISSEERPS